jgi:hypothetical protein
MNEEHGGHDGMAAGIGARLRREADLLPPGPPPIRTVVRQGRRIRLRRRAATSLAFAFVAALLLPLGLAALPDARRPSDPVAPAHPSTVRVVRSGEDVGLGHGLDWTIFLRGQAPGGATGLGYVLVPADEDDTRYGFPTDPTPEAGAPSLSGYLTDVPGAVIVSGSWWTGSDSPPPSPPSSISVTYGGTTRNAALLRLRSTPGWGAYYAVFEEEGKGSPREEDARAEMLDANGRTIGVITGDDFNADIFADNDNDNDDFEIPFGRL